MSDDLKKLKEVEVPITLRGLWNGVKKITYTFPIDMFQKTARAADKFSKKMMTGYLAAVTMPLGLMIRNGATVAHNAGIKLDNDDGTWQSVAAYIGAGVSAIAAVWFSGTAIYAGLVSKFALTGFLTKGAAVVTSATAGAFIGIPAFTAGLLVTATTLGVAATALSVVPALANIPTAFSRSIARFKGQKINEKDLQAELAKNSVSSRYEANLLQEAKYALRSLDKTGRKEMFETLKKEFEPQATKKASQEVATNTPTSKAKAPKSKR